MEIRIYDAKLDLKGIIENQTSLIWTGRYFEPGEFELHAPVTASNLSVLKIGSLVTMSGRQDAGVIEDLAIVEGMEERGITARGRFLASYMDRRLIRGTVNVNGKVGEVMRRLLSGAAPLPLVEPGGLKGSERTVTGQIRYKNLLRFETKLARYGGLGFRFRPDFTAKKIYFDIYQGIDRSAGQTENGRVIFSENYDNLDRAEYRANDQGCANVAYVLGKDAEGTETILEVGETESAGLERREIFVDATGVDAKEIPADEWKASVRMNGQNTLNARSFSETFECEILPSGNFSYRTHYDLGDIVTVRKAGWDIQRDLRVTEVQETYEHGAAAIRPVLGNPLPTSIDWGD